MDFKKLLLFVSISTSVNFAFLQNYEIYLFSEEMQKIHQSDSLHQQSDSLILKAAYLQNYRLAQSFLQQEKTPSLKQDSTLVETTLSEWEKHFLELLSKENVVFLNDVFPYQFSRNLLRRLIPEIHKLGVAYLGVDGLAVDSICLQDNERLTDSLSRNLRDPLFRKLIEATRNILPVFNFEINGMDFIHRYPTEKILVLTDFKTHFDSLENCYQSEKINQIIKAIPHAYFVDVRWSEQDSNTCLQNIKTQSAPEVENIHEVVCFSSMIEDEMMPVEQGMGSFEVPKERIIEYPVILLKYKKSEFNSQGFPLEVREICSVEENTTFKIDKGEYTFVFLYTTRDMYHTLNVKKTR